MIFNLSSEYANSNQGVHLSEICCKIIYKQHYIACDSNTKNLISNSINQHGSTSQKELLRQYKGFDITAEIRKYFTTIETSTLTDSMLDSILNKPSRMLIENSYNEWDVYKCIIGTYKHDRKYKNLFTALELAKNKGLISYLHGGGYTAYTNLIEQNNNEDYNGVFKYKVCILFDRDTDNASCYDSQKNTLFRFLCGKNNLTISDSDIYNLNQTGYIWHMWYKRSIENYFPDASYEAIGVNVAQLPVDKFDRDYYNFSQVTGYNKNQLPLLTVRMKRTDYEKELKTFTVNGEQMTELQLLLLKLVKII